MPAEPDQIDARPYRIDPLTGAVVHVVADRQARPNLPPAGCPFCPGGLEAPEPYDVLAFPNRWPALPDGRCEVVLYTPDHDATFWSLGVEGAGRVVDLWAGRSAALGRRDDVAYVLVFENRGPAVGATIAHPHGQIYAFATVPPNALVELTRPESAEGLGPGATGADDALLVSGSGGWRAWVPAAAAWPYELVLAPVDRLPDLPSLGSGVRTGLATTLVDALARLDALFHEPMPYMLWIHQRPFDGGHWPEAWLHLHIAPIHRRSGTPRFVAAGELGSGIFFNPIAPDRAAHELRRAR